jgi:hypothetical protein
MKWFDQRMETSMSTTLTASRALEAEVNAIFGKVEAGFSETSEMPVMTTPMIVPAATMVIQGSTICLVC